MTPRTSRTILAAVCTALAAAVLVPTATSAGAAPLPSTDPVGTLTLLSDPFLQLPGADDVHVAWATGFAGDRHAVLLGDSVSALTAEQAAAAAAGASFPGVRVVIADSRPFSRLAEDAASRIPDEVRPAREEGVVARAVWRHEARVDGLAPGTSTPYRVVSTDADDVGASGTFRLAPAPRPGDGLRVLLTSDHQSMVNTPANLEMAAATLGRIDAVFLAGDLVNVPDRASEWFDDTRGSAFFAALQGNGGRVDSAGIRSYAGGEIIQNAPLFPAVGNHEVQGRIADAISLNGSYNAPVPRSVAEAVYEERRATVNPADDPEVRERWIEDNSFSTTSYEEMFTLPDAGPGGETYYAVTFGDVRLVSLSATRIWRGTAADADPAARTATSRYQEASTALGDPLAQGYGEHIFEAIGAGSAQYDWLRDELASDAFQDARFRVVMLHEGPQGLGDNVMPHFADPVRIEERDDAGALVGVRYEYPAEDNVLLRDVAPLLEAAGADLVHNGHSHLWNRFVSDGGVNYLETSNTGNTYGAYHPQSGRSRPVPPAPWNSADYLAQGNPGGLAPVVPSVAPLLDMTGAPQPFVQDSSLAVFSVLDTAAGEVVSYRYDVRTPDQAPQILDRFPLGRPAAEPPVVDPPAVDPPADETPVAEPPVEEAPVAEPPAVAAPDGSGDDSLASTGSSAGGALLAAAAAALAALLGGLLLLHRQHAQRTRSSAADGRG